MVLLSTKGAFGFGNEFIDDSGEEVETVFEKFPIASWTVGNSDKFAFPVISIRESGGNRIIRRPRPYRNGAKLDDTGSVEKVWMLEAVFENTIDEPGLEANSEPLYPTILDSLIESFDKHETGDLVIPTRGSARCRIESYERTDKAEDRDFGLLSMTFVQDNEDNVDAASFTAPTANANARRLGETTTFDAQFDEMWSQNLRNIERSSQNIESVSNKPGEVSKDVEDSADVITSAATTTERSFSNPAKVSRNKLIKPESSKTQRKLVKNKDVAARAKNEARKGRPKITTIVVSGDTDLFTVATYLNQDFMDLLGINPGLDNPNFIPKGTVIKVFNAQTT